MFFSMDTGLAGKGVIITGGAGGIGQAVVRAFGAEGARVAVHYRTSKLAAEQLAAEVGGVALGADLRVETEGDNLIPRAVEALGRVDVVVANAGVWPPADRPIWELPLDRWKETLEANLTATFLTVRGFLRHAANTGQGNLVMISSTAGIFGEAGHADYAAAKGAILSGLLLSAKNEATRLGGEIRVKASRGDEGLVIEVSDTGEGIPGVVMEGLFKPFHTTKPGGLGLGLAYCKRAVAAHGGSINVETTVGAGAIFKIQLPDA